MNNRVKKSHLPAFLLNNRTKLPSQRPKTASHRYRSSKQRPQRPSTSNPIRRSSKNRSRSDLSTQLDVLLHSQPKTIDRRAAIYSACLKSLSQQITDVETSRLLIKLKEGIDKIHTDHQTLLIATQKENLQLKQQLQQQHYKRSPPPQDVLTSFTLNDNEDELQSTDSEEEMLNDSRLILTEIDQLNRPEDFIELETIESDPNEEEMEGSTTTWSVPMKYVDPWLKQNDSEIEQKKANGWETARMKTSEMSTQTDSIIAKDNTMSPKKKKKKKKETSSFVTPKRSIGTGTTVTMNDKKIGTEPIPKMKNMSCNTDPVKKKKKRMKKKTRTNTLSTSSTTNTTTSAVNISPVRRTNQRRLQNKKKVIQKMCNSKRIEISNPALLFEEVLALDVPVVTRLLKMLPKTKSNGDAPKIWKLSTTLEYIRSIYDIAMSDQLCFKNKRFLPEIILDDSTNTFGVPSLVKGRVIDMLWNIRKYRANNVDVDYFGQLLEETHRNGKEFLMCIICKIELKKLNKRNRENRENESGTVAYKSVIESDTFTEKIATSTACDLVAVVLNRFSGSGTDDVVLDAMENCLNNIENLSSCSDGVKSKSGTMCCVHLFDVITQGVRHVQTQRRLVRWATKRFHACDLNEDGFIDKFQFMHALNIVSSNVDDRSLSLVYQDAIRTVGTNEMSLRLFLYASNQILRSSRIVSVSHGTKSNSWTNEMDMNDHDERDVMLNGEDLPDLSSMPLTIREPEEDENNEQIERTKKQEKNQIRHEQEQKRAATQLLTSLNLRWEEMHFKIRKHVDWCCHAENMQDVQMGTKMLLCVTQLVKILDDVAGSKKNELKEEMKTLVERATNGLYYYCKVLRLVNEHQCWIRKMVGRSPLYLPAVEKELNSLENSVKVGWERFDMLEGCMKTLNMCDWQEEMVEKCGVDFGKWLFQMDEVEGGMMLTKTDRCELYPIYEK